MPESIMTDTALRNALILAAAAVVAWFMAGRFLAGRGGAVPGEGGMRPFMAEKDGPADTAEEGTAELLARRYAVKGRFRMAVLAFSLLALAAYVWGESRTGALLLLSCAGLCQYGAHRQRTSACLAQALRRGSFAAPEGDRRGGAANKADAVPPRR